MKYILTSLLLLIVYFVLQAFVLLHATESNTVDDYAAKSLLSSNSNVQEKAKNIYEAATTQAEILQTLKEEISKLNTEIEKAKDEEKEVLVVQIRSKYSEYIGNLKKLSQLVVQLESIDEKAQKFQQLAVGFSELVSKWLKSEISASLKLLSLLEQKLKTASETELPELKLNIANERAIVDEQLSALLENSERMEQLGIDSSLEYSYLDGILMQRADNLAARLQYYFEQREGLRKQLREASEEEKSVLKQKISSLDIRITSIAGNLRLTSDLMDERNLETVKYKQLLVSTTGELSSDIFESDVALQILQQWLISSRERIIDQGPKWAFKLIIFFLIISVFAILAKVVKKLALRTLTSSKVNTSILLQNLFVAIAGKGILVVGILIGLSQLGFKVGPILAGLGIVGFILGFALQETLSNFAAGLMILIYRPFDIGDAIEAGGISGKVSQMNLVSTTINTFDNKRMIVPNNKVWGNTICNINAEKTRRVDLVFGIGYEDDVELAEKILHEIVDNYQQILKDPEPIIQVHTLGESSVEFIVRPWVNSSDYWAAYWHIIKTVKKRFDEKGISIPFPQRDIHLFPVERNVVKSNQNS